MKEIFNLMREQMEKIIGEVHSPADTVWNNAVKMCIATVDEVEAKWKEKEAEPRASVIDEFAQKAKTDFIDYDMYLILHSNGIMNPQESVEYYKYMVDCFAREMKGEKSLSFKEFNEVREAEYERDI